MVKTSYVVDLESVSLVHVLKCNLSFFLYKFCMDSGMQEDISEEVTTSNQKDVVTGNNQGEINESTIRNVCSTPGGGGY